MSTGNAQEEKLTFRAYINYTATVCVDIRAENLTEAREIAEDLDPEDYADDIEELLGEVGDVVPLPDCNLDR